MDKDDKETLLALYKEKMSYLMAYDKIYSWMLGLLGMGLIVVIGFVLQHNVLQPSTGSSDFYDGEFTLPYSVEGLYFAIVNDANKLVHGESCNGLLCKITEDWLFRPSVTVAWLNDQLRKPELYDALCQNKLPKKDKKDGEVFSDNLMNLEHITTNDRLKSFLNLSATKQSIIKKLNRRLLEEKYPNETPKREAEAETTSAITILIIFVLFPLIIIAWFSAYIFCYWYSYLLCQNIEYIERLITKDIFFPHDYKLATWRNNFFSIFYGETKENSQKTPKWSVHPLFVFIGYPLLVLYWCILSIAKAVSTPVGKWSVYLLFVFIGLPLLALYGIIGYEITNPHYFIEELSFKWEPLKWILLYIYMLMPAIILCIHVHCSVGEKEKLKKIYRYEIFRGVRRGTKERYR